MNRIHIDWDEVEEAHRKSIGAGYWSSFTGGLLILDIIEHSWFWVCVLSASLFLHLRNFYWQRRFIRSSLRADLLNQVAEIAERNNEQSNNDDRGG